MILEPVAYQCKYDKSTIFKIRKDGNDKWAVYYYHADMYGQPSALPGILKYRSGEYVFNRTANFDGIMRFNSPEEAFEAIQLHIAHNSGKVKSVYE